MRARPVASPARHQRQRKAEGRQRLAPPERQMPEAEEATAAQAHRSSGPGSTGREK
jgi:hypothetical protein